MKKFNIKVITKKPQIINGLEAYKGEITIGNLKEKFIMPITSWSLQDYQNQWKEGLARIKTHDTSCLVITAQNMDTYPFIWLWILYRVKENVFFHEQLLNPEIAPRVNPLITLSEFNSTTCYQFISPRLVNKKGEAVNKYKEKIFEASIPLSEI